MKRGQASEREESGIRGGDEKGKERLRRVRRLFVSKSILH